MDHLPDNVVNPGDALRWAQQWGDRVIGAATERLDPFDEVQFLTEGIALLTERRDETSTFIHGDDEAVVSGSFPAVTGL